MPTQGHAQTKPIPIRLGNTTTSGEDQIWLMKARPDLTPNQGKAYTLETNPFRGGDLRFRAFQAGQVDGAVSTGTGAVTAAVKGVPLVIVAAISEEDDAFYSSPYVVMDASPIRSVKDLKGKTIGLNGLREAFELGSRLALLDAGLDPDRDVKWAVVPPPNMGEALRTGKVDLVSLSQPFYAAEAANGGIRTLFTQHTATGFKDEFLLYFNPDFVKKNRDAMRAFLSDFVAATKFYMANTGGARVDLQGEARGDGSGRLHAHGRVEPKGRRPAVARISRGAAEGTAARRLHREDNRHRDGHRYQPVPEVNQPDKKHPRRK